MQGDLSGVASAILGAIVGGILGAGAPLFIDHWYRPKLELEEDRPERGRNWSCHAIAVTNRGLRTAKNCHGMIRLEAGKWNLCPDDQLVHVSDLERSLKDEFAKKFHLQDRETFLLHHENWRNIDDELLAWSQLENPRSIDIYPHTHPLLDVVRYMRVPRRMKQLHFASEGGWACLRGAFEVNEYALTITVGAENARAATRKYRVVPNADEDDISLIPEPLPRRWWFFGR